MVKQRTIRNYSLTGPESGPGFSSDQWYSSDIPRKKLKSLMQRSDKLAFINCGLWLSALILSGVFLIMTWGTPWAWLAAFIYATFYASGGDSRWHEFGHGTPFKTLWLNEVFYIIASYMSLKNPTIWRWSHARHHTDTIIVGRDPEIAFPRPPSISEWILNFLYIPTVLKEVWKSTKLSFGVLSPDQKDYLPESEWQKAFWTGRLHVGLLIITVIVALILESWLPLFLSGLPTFYGSWLHHLMATTQHAGLAEDIPDHRMNSRTVYLNPLFQFIYCNMNYHVEHHMYPMVPYYNLPALHAEIKHDCPKAYASLFECYREMIPAILRQQKDPNYYIERPVPKEATPSPNYVRPKFSTVEENSNVKLDSSLQYQ